MKQVVRDKFQFVACRIVELEEALSGLEGRSDLNADEEAELMSIKAELSECRTVIEWITRNCFNCSTGCDYIRSDSRMPPCCR